MPGGAEVPGASARGECPAPVCSVSLRAPLFAPAQLGIYHRNMRWIADLCYLLASLLFLPVALYNALFVGKNRAGWGQRFGFVPRFPPVGQRVWLHAVSLGEINATPRLVEALRQRLPDCDIVISTTTDTGYARAVQLYGRERVFRFPLDFSLVMSRVLDQARPSCIVLVELEVWYNLLALAERRGIPVAVVNGRLTERSASRFGLLGGLVRPMFGRLSWVGAQDEDIAARFSALGTPKERVEITSSMKWDTALVADSVDGQQELAAALGITSTNRPIWVCGSTGPEEEDLLLDTYASFCAAVSTVARNVHGGTADESVAGATTDRPILALIPRKPERFDEVARLIERAGFSCVRRSMRPDDEPAPSMIKDDEVILGDTMGELRKFYALAAVVFVGRSLVAMGGSDPIEVAALGKPVICGPHMENFRQPVAVLARAAALRQVGNAAELAQVVRALLANGDLRSQMGQAAQQAVVGQQGATQRTVERLVRLMSGGRPTTHDREES